MSYIPEKGVCSGSRSLCFAIAMLQIRSDQPGANDEPALFKLLVHQLRHAAIFFIDVEGCLASWNPGVEALLGYKESEWIGQPGEIIFTPEDRAAGVANRELATAAANGDAAEVRWHLRKDRTRIFVDGLTQSLRDADGNLLGFAKLMRDATERQVAREALQATLESISGAFYTLDKDSRFTYVNRRAEESWHRDRRELIGRCIWDIFPAAIGSQGYEMHNICLVERTPVRFETISDVSGSWIEVSIYPDMRGGLSCYFRDIENRKRNEHRLQKLTEGLNLTQVMIRGMDGTIEFWSEGCARLFGFSEQEAVGCVSHHLLHTEFPEALSSIEAQLLSTGVWQGELRHLRKDGSLVISKSDWVLHRGSDGELMAVIEANTDITGQKAAQEQLQRANHELRQFSHIVSHDLQAPVRMVRGYAKLLSKRYQSKLDQTGDEFLTFILQGAESMQTLIRTLLEYAQSAEEPAKKQPVQVEAVVNAVLMALRPEINESGTQVAAGELPTVEADPVQLQQVFQNLIGNAIKYRKPGTPLSIDIQVESRPQEWLFKVKDTGIGIDARFHERIFEPLRRLHGSEITGTGIGLAVCKRIIERHGGRIWVKSQPGHGSTFLFCLPRYSAV